MKKGILFILLGMTIALVSCGSDDKGGNPSPTKPPNTLPPGAGDNTEYLDNQEDLRAKLQESTVKCLYSDECPDNVAKLVFWQKRDLEEGYDYGVCSGTLINQDTIVTNAHCIPSNISFAGAKCYGQILVQYPSISRGENYRSEENVDCLTVEEVGDYFKSGSDYAVLKIQKSKYIRKAVKVKHGQMNDISNIYAYTMNPSKNDASGVIEKKKCRISKKNIYLGIGNQYQSDALIYGYDCQVVGGNSGSGVFNELGEMIGIIHSRLDIGVIKSEFRKREINYNFYNYMGLFVNIGCVPSLANQDTVQDCIVNDIDESELTEYIQERKEFYDYTNEDDRLIKATVGEGLALELTLKEDDSYWYTRYSLENFLNSVLELFQTDNEGDNAWAKVFKK